MFESYGEMLFRVDRWHATEDYASIIDLLGARPIGELNFELTLKLAQAHIRLAEASDREERLDRLGFAETLLNGVADAGMPTTEWCLAMGEVLLAQLRYSEAMPFLERAVDIAPMNVAAQRARATCFSEIEHTQIVRPVTQERIAAFLDKLD